MSAQMDVQDEDIASSFRKHRHDVLNLLQLMRAYIQVERDSDAIRVIDTTALWLQSLTKWQTRCKGVASELVWTAANCPHVILSDIGEHVDWNLDMVLETRQLLTAIEQGASQMGWSPIYISICRQNDPTVDDYPTIFCELPIELSCDDFLQLVPTSVSMPHMGFVLVDKNT